jgi:lactate racemase
MQMIGLRYGVGDIPFEFEARRFDVLDGATGQPMSDAELGKRIESPIGAEPLEDRIGPGESVLFVVPDGTRKAGAGQMINLLVRRLIANGTMPYDIAAIFATGIHRPVTEAEKQEILTPFIAQRVKTIDHSSRDLMGLMHVGETSGGIRVELNRALVEFENVITIGAVGFHYFAGFTGGRKLVCPGLASSRTIAETHRLAFDAARLDRREGVGPGLLDGNAVHEACVEAASMARVGYSINTIVNEDGAITELFCGDPVEAHREACESFRRANTVEIGERRGVVIVSCGGSPHDINMIQAHKALDAAAAACEPGGRLILLAECGDGLGRDDFIDWFDAADHNEVANRLAENYKVNGQTAWSLLKKAESFDIRIVTSLPAEIAEKMRIRKCDSLSEALEGLEDEKGYVIPRGARVMIRSTD